MPRLSKRSVGAVLWHTLIYHAKKMAVRSDLVDGSATPVQLKLSGIIGGQHVSESLSGRLTVGEPTDAASSCAAAQVDVTAYLLSLIPTTRRQLELEQLPKQFAKRRCVPAVSDEIREQATALLRQLRTQVTAKREGVIRFEPDGAPATKAKAA